MSNTRPDLVLQDLALPDVDGLSLARKLRELPGRDDVPIVAFSAFISRLEEARATSDVFRAFIPKPILVLRKNWIHVRAGVAVTCY
jgi:CheY-like chemotaxis protein